MTVLQRSSVNVFTPSPTTPFLVSLSWRPYYYYDVKSKNGKLRCKVQCAHITNSSHLKPSNDYITYHRKIRCLRTTPFMPSLSSYFTNSNAYHNCTIQEYSTQSTDRSNVSSINTRNNTGTYPKKIVDEKELSSHHQDRRSIQVVSSSKNDAEKKQMEQLTERLLNTNIDDIESKLISLDVMECTKAIFWWCSYSSNNINHLSSSSYEAMELAETLFNKLIQHQLNNPSIKILTLEHVHAVLDGWRRYDSLQGKIKTSIRNEMMTIQPASLQCIS